MTGACVGADDGGSDVVREPEELVFLESGTWVKPEGATWVRVEIRAGDGGPASTGEAGGPGCGRSLLMRAEWVPESVPVRVGGSPGGRGDATASGDGWARVTTFFCACRPYR